MILFVDASALVAIITGDESSLRLTKIIRSQKDIIWSAISRWETVAGLRHAHQLALSAARERVSAFASDNRFRMVAIGEREAELALDAYSIYGKGRHKAALNMGDCFTYACAKANDARLVYKGDDFLHTDLA